MLEEIFASHGWEFLKLQKCAYGKILWNWENTPCVYQLCGWEVGQRQQTFEILAFSIISIAPCQLPICFVPSVRIRGILWAGLCMVIRVSVLLGFFIPAWQQGLKAGVSLEWTWVSGSRWQLSGRHGGWDPLQCLQSCVSVERLWLHHLHCSAGPLCDQDGLHPVKLIKGLVILKWRAWITHSSIQQILF